MLQQYESPTFKIERFEFDTALMAFAPSNTTDFIPDTDSDDDFDW